MSAPPPNWYPDPWDALLHRWWDGRQWTTHTAPRRTVPAVARVSSVSDEVAHRPGKIENAWSSAAARRPTTNKSPDLAQLAAAMHLEPLRADLDEQIEVAGETYHVKGIKRVFREANIPITNRGATVEVLICALIPEPWNPHDPHAVAVMVGPHHVGYIPAELAAEYSPALCPMAAAGTVISGHARIWAKDDGGMIRARVTVLAPAVDSL